MAIVLAAGMICPPAQALVTLNDGHDRIYVTGTMGVTHDSNVFAANGSVGDFLYSTSFNMEYQRRAGWIGVNAGVAISGGQYGSLQGQNYKDPSFSLELTKQTGRTTGSITLNAVRESRADAAINTRSQSWNVSYGMGFRYHITGSYDLAGNFGYSQRKYADEVAFTNLSTFSSAFDLFHPVSSERDAILGYRYRFSESTRDTSSADHSFTFGVHGKIIRGISGTMRVGYQFRAPDGRTVSAGAKYQSWTASGTASYAINKKINLGGMISKDFSTTATDSSVDALVASLDAIYAFNSHLSFSTSLGWGNSKFLGDGGRVVLDPGPPVILGAGRQDTNVNLTGATSYGLNEHLKFSLSYTWFKNWSTISFADFVRSSWSFNMSSRW